MNEIIEWMRAVLAQDDKRNAYVEAEMKRIKDSGGRFITWTGGGGETENRIYDRDTNELLAITEDTVEAFSAAWQDNWYNPDSIWQEAYNRFEDPEMPEDFAFLLNENYEPEDFRKFLEDWSA